MTYHPETAQAWAYVYLGDKAKAEQSSVVVNEDIESFASPAEAQRVMQENRDQLANCHKFVADNAVDNKRLTFTHRAIRVPRMGDEAVAHQLNGLSNDRSFLVANMVEVRSGTDMIFIDYWPSQRGTAKTVAIASAAMRKYSTVRR